MAVHADPAVAEFQRTLSLFQALVILRPLLCEFFVTLALLVLELLGFGSYVIAYGTGAGRTSPQTLPKSAQIRYMRWLRYFNPIRRWNIEARRPTSCWVRAFFCRHLLLAYAATLV
jgi:hypothetical protein